MVWKWLLHNWLGVITAIGVLYGIVLSTYNFIEFRRTKKRRLDVKLAHGEFRDAPVGVGCHPMFFIEVANSGYSPVTIEAPYFELDNGQTYVPPEVTADVHFPFELNACKSCSRAVRYIDLVRFFGTSCGYKGEVWVYGAVRDLTGKIWKSKQAWPLGLRNGKQSNKSARMEQEAIHRSEGNWRSYLKYEGTTPYGDDRIRLLLNFLKESPGTIADSAAITVPLGLPAERMKLLEYCWEEKLIDCEPIQTEQHGIVDFVFIRITTQGREFIRSL